MKISQGNKLFFCTELYIREYIYIYIYRLSITFLSRILQPLPSKRYTAEEAIKHPWVTRKHTRIPKTMHEKLFDLSVQDKFRSLAKVLIFASSLKQTKVLV